MTSAVPRLKRRSEFVRVAKLGRRWVAPGLVLQMLARGNVKGKNCSLPPIRVGFTASRRVGNAVIRNRVRRRLRSAADEVLPNYAMRGCDYVVIGRVATVKRSYQGLLIDLTVALKRLGAAHARQRRKDAQGRADSNVPGA